MNITTMTPGEKSLRLARLVWRGVGSSGVFWWDGDNSVHHVGEADIPMTPLDLYDTGNMALAWQILNWAAGQKKTVKAQKGGGVVEWEVSWSDLIDNDISPDGSMFHLPLAEAQAAWLDKILELAIEAGMVTE